MSGASDRVAARPDELTGKAFADFKERVAALRNIYDSLVLSSVPMGEIRGDFDKKMNDGLAKLRDLLDILYRGLEDVSEGKGDAVTKMGTILQNAAEVADSLARQMPSGTNSGRGV
ncbi:hypothetical protein AB0J86_33415 [Micromonospora sp. NPDC049559]|uniref:hypothetical protein n=1 Tax=Micromonospora sp. NPDC049559 TaxID=3155923 RepID=UPI00343C3FA7